MYPSSHITSSHTRVSQYLLNNKLLASQFPRDFMAWEGGKQRVLITEGRAEMKQRQKWLRTAEERWFEAWMDSLSPLFSKDFSFLLPKQQAQASFLYKLISVLGRRDKALLSFELHLLYVKRSFIITFLRRKTQ